MLTLFKGLTVSQPSAPISGVRILRIPCHSLTTYLNNIGNPYATEIKRKRIVEDPSLPDFDNPMPPLKWANWMMLRDVKRRHLVSRYWQYRMNLLNISHSQTLPNIIRETATTDRNSTPRQSSIAHYTNRCSLTSRARGKFDRYRLSRIVWRDLADHGMLSSAIRAKWG